MGLSLFKSKNKTLLLPAARKNNFSQLVAIDIGTNRIRLIAADVKEDGSIEVIYYNETKSHGVIAGSVCDLDSLTNALSVLVSEFERATNSTLVHCVIGISGFHIYSYNDEGFSTIQSRVVTVSDKNRAIEYAKSGHHIEGSHIIHVIPNNFIVENNREVINPIGLHALRLGVAVHIILCSIDQENNFRSAITNLSPNVSVDSVIFNGIAAASAVLSESEKEIGVCLIDFGAGTVDVCVYDKKKLVISFSIDRGGNRITEAIASEFHVPLLIAEELKQKIGVAHKDILSDEEKEQTYNVIADVDKGLESDVIIDPCLLADVISQNILDIFNTICLNIENKARERNMALNLGAGFVLTGGMAKLRGIDKLASVGLNPNHGYVSVKLGHARKVLAEANTQIDPDKSVALGLIRFAHENALEESEVEQVPKGSVQKFVKAVRDWISKEF